MEEGTVKENLTQITIDRRAGRYLYRIENAREVGRVRVQADLSLAGGDYFGVYEMDAAVLRRWGVDAWLWWGESLVDPRYVFVNLGPAWPIVKISE